MKRNGNSLLWPQIEKFLEQKRALGYQYNRNQAFLIDFDIFCQSQFPAKENLDRELCLEWAIVRKSESVNSFNRRISVIRELARYIISVGGEAFIIPKAITKRKSKYIPHIFTGSELVAIFDSADNYDYNPYYPTRHLVLSTIFRLLYCCGLRPGEALRLRCSDIDLVTGRIFIAESKVHKERVVMMSDNMLDIMAVYDWEMQKILPNRKMFFPKADGNPYGLLWLEVNFHACWNKVGLGKVSGNQPRPYDFRHTFATHCLYRWLKEGKNIDALLPYLSAYMGHERFEDTAYYIHLVPEFFPTMGSMNVEKFSSLIPEVTL